jgi:hypothetical protein
MCWGNRSTGSSFSSDLSGAKQSIECVEPLHRLRTLSNLQFYMLVVHLRPNRERVSWGCAPVSPCVHRCSQTLFLFENPDLAVGTERLPPSLCLLLRALSDGPEATAAQATTDNRCLTCPQSESVALDEMRAHGHRERCCRLWREFKSVALPDARAAWTSRPSVPCT